MIINHESGFEVGSDRYGSRKNADGGCAHCGHSFYQHSTGYDNQWHCKPGCKCDGFYIANAGPMRCSCGGKITKVGDDDFECDDCGQRYETDDWRSDRLKARNSRRNAVGYCDICDHSKKNHPFGGCLVLGCKCSGYEAGRREARQNARTMSVQRI